jgi:hypothetical protein
MSAPVRCSPELGGGRLALGSDSSPHPNRTVHRTATGSDLIPSSPRQFYGGNDSSVGVDETEARFDALGISAKPNKPKPCPCVLHADHDAVVFYDPRGFWAYRCDRLGRAIGLAEVRAHIAFNADARPTPVQLVRWGERLDYEAGLLDLLPLDVRLPMPTPKCAAILSDYMQLLVGLRRGRGEDFLLDEPFVFTGRFAEAYSSLSADQIREGKAWLRDSDVIYRVDEAERKHRTPIRWKFAAQDAAPGLIPSLNRRENR